MDRILLYSNMPGPTSHRTKPIRAQLTRTKSIFRAWVHTITLASALVALQACGVDFDAGDLDDVLLITPRFMIGTEIFDCDELPAIRFMEADLRDELTGEAIGISTRRGSCGSVQLNRPLSGEEFEIEVRALGPLLDQDEAVLFRVVTKIGTSRPFLSLALQPEVAFVELNWSFSGFEASICPPDVARVDVALRPEGSAEVGSPFSYTCAASPVRLPSPYTALTHRIDVSGVSIDRLPIYSHSNPAFVLERGLNHYTAVLTSTGTQLLTDWVFRLGDEILTACDDERTQVTELTAVVRGLIDGSPPVFDGTIPRIEKWPCTLPRPVAFSTRFETGRLLELELSAEGFMHTYRSLKQFVVPELSSFQQVVVLDAVGTSTASFTIINPSCPTEPSTYRFSLTREGTSEPEAITFFVPGQLVFLEHLPYGRYEVRVEPEVPVMDCEPLTTTRVIDRRLQGWTSFEL